VKFEEKNMKTTAIVLFAHGARDPRWAAPFQRLQKLTQDSLPEVQVELAFLEFMSPQLPELVATMAENGICDITLCPIFLGQGGHVLRDLPILVGDLRQQFPQLKINQVQAAGEDAKVLAAIRDYCVNSMQLAPSV
jgi:sirohydrochlorin cobaltochelatase